MLVRGKPVSWTTGTDVEHLKERLIRAYFHIPDSPKPGSKKKKPR